jgi:folylpolyglutamate synthase/dihydropteroate synthase
MLRLSEHFGNPHKNNFKVVHVAGTNGKGTVSLKTAKGL